MKSFEATINVDYIEHWHNQFRHVQQSLSGVCESELMTVNVTLNVQTLIAVELSLS